MSQPDEAFGRKARPPGAPKQLAVGATSLAVIALAAAYVLSWVPMFPCMLLDHFRVQLAATGVVLVGVAAALRVRRPFAVAVIATLLHAIPVASDLMAQRPTWPSREVPLRVLVLNVHTESTSFAAVRQLITDEHPDVIGLVEVNQRWLDELAPALVAYPGRIEAPRPDNFGIALYARGDVRGAAQELGSPLPSVVAEVSIGGARLLAIVTHPLPPMSSAALAQQERQLEAVAERARVAATPVVVMGDLNATPWSEPFRDVVERSGLCDSRAGFGIQASFPATSTVLRIPIDHLLASCSVGVRDRRIGRDVGSDHLPVIVDLAVPAP